MIASGRRPRASRAMAPVLARRRWVDPSGGGIGTHLTRDARGAASPDVTSAVTSCPSAASPSATAATWTDPPLVPGTVWSIAEYRILIGRACSLDSFEQGKERTRFDAAEQEQVQLHRGAQRAEQCAHRAALRDAFLSGGSRGLERVLVAHRGS